MDYKTQLALWRQGRSLHNDELNQCCPDFSCCNPSLLAPQEMRDLFCKAYAENNEDLIQSILVSFLQLVCNEIVKSDPDIESVTVVDTTNYTIPS